MRYKSLLLLGLLVLSGQAVATLGGGYHAASLTEADWRVDRGPLQCRLLHTVEGFGEVAFEQRAGGRLGLAVYPARLDLSAMRARLRERPPVWRHGVRGGDLGTLTDVEPAAVFRTDEPGARRVLASLQRGMVPTIDWSQKDLTRAPVSVAVSAINLQPALENFERCQASLLDYDFDDIRHTVVRFGAGSATLNTAARRQLDRLVAWTRLDDSVARVTVAGYSDALGAMRSNWLLSRQRARNVRSYLRKAGLTEPRYSLMVHGEARPVASNAHAEGRALNRRVEVRLTR